MIGFLLAAQLESSVVCLHIRLKLVCERFVELICVCEPGKPAKELKLRQVQWKSPII